MVKILNSLEELYQLITGTLPEGYVEHIPKVNWDMISTSQYGAIDTRATCYFTIEDVAAHDRVKIEYGKRFKPIVTDGRIYKYV
jgi:hypothetical protein